MWVQRTVADVKFVMEALFPLLPCEHPLHTGKIISSSNKGPYTFGVWMSFSGVPLDERIRGCMEAIPSRLKSAGGLMSACLTKGPSLNLTRLHKSLQVRVWWWWTGVYHVHIFSSYFIFGSPGNHGKGLKNRTTSCAGILQWQKSCRKPSDKQAQEKARRGNECAEWRRRHCRRVPWEWGFGGTHCSR